MPQGSMCSLAPSPWADYRRFVTELAHRPPSTCDSVAPEGGGKQVPTQGGGCRQVTDAWDLTSGEVPG
jgi:hypothetical protein